MNASRTPVAGGRRVATTCPRCGATMDSAVLSLQKPRLLVVEGRDEEEFFTALVSHLDLPETQVAGVGGKEKIGPRLKALVRDPRFPVVQSLGVIRDADADPKGAFESVRNALVAAGLPFPKGPLQPAIGPPRVNVMILPSSARKGSLEDLCLETITDDPVAGCMGDFFDCLTRELAVTPRTLPKAKVRVFLASRPDPTLPLGLAAQRGYWPLEHEALLEIRGFLLSM